MEAGISTARQARTQHRHELRTLTYVTLDQANGGIVRNLSHQGIGVQLVAAVRPGQQLRVRLELRYPRVRVETRGEVMWSTFSGQCGIRFLDMPPRMMRHVDEWIFADLLECAALHAEPDARGSLDEAAAQDDGLRLSAAPRKVIQLPLRPEPTQPRPAPDETVQKLSDTIELDWLSQPLTGRSLEWTVNTLVVFAALLLFALVFLSVTREAPRWPLRMAGGAAAIVAALYWGFFHVFGGSSLGARLARLADSAEEASEEARSARFR